MNEETNFSKLSASLSKYEKKELLEKIESVISLKQEPFQFIEEKEKINLEEHYSSLNFIQKIILIIKSILTKIDRLQLVEKSLLEKIENNIKKINPELISFKTCEFLPQFNKEVLNLKKSMEIFHAPLGKALIEEKEWFIAFLIGMEFPMLQERFLAEIDPGGIAEEYPLKTDYEIKREVEYRMDNIFKDIDENDRKQIYINMKAVHFLKDLVFFNFEQILSGFTVPGKFKAGHECCLINDIKKQVLELTDILYNFTLPPNKVVLEALFLFCFKDEIETSSIKIEDEMDHFIKSAKNAFLRIRTFNQDVPLGEIAKIMQNNILYTPRVMGGSEDWFYLYKQFWSRTGEEKCQAFMIERKKKKSEEDLCDLLKIDILQNLDYYRSGIWDEDVKIQYETSIKFTMEFLKQLFFPEIIEILKLILFNGEFYKSQNRDEFTNSYNSILKAYDDIKKLDEVLSQKGEIREAFEFVKKEMISNKLKQKKINSIFKKCNKEAQEIISCMLQNLNVINKVIKGILYGEFDGRYDTLSNIDNIGRKDGVNFRKAIEEIYKKMESIRNILNEMYNLELN